MSLPASWIDALFTKLSAFYGKHFADMWAGQDMLMVKAVWSDELDGLTREQLKHGFEACRRLKFPPTLPEFISLCQPAVDPEELFREALIQLRRRDMDQPESWSSPLPFWAALQYGVYEMRHDSWERASKRWTRIVNELQAKALDPVPPKAVAVIEHKPTPTMTKEEAMQRLAEIRAKMRDKSPDVADAFDAIGGQP